MSGPRGVTLLQLLGGLLALWVVASLAISRVVAVRQREYRELVTSELARLARAQEAYAASTRHYAADPALAGYTPPERVNVAVGGAGVVTGTGWSATAEHRALPGLKCYIGVGADTVVGAVKTKSGAVVCRKER